ncbi:ATP-binding protein [Actinoplanes couchii]|uniref:Histidine kinase n=1 Tax=Actinoplanes couchii TaxID=403638 RepID=A0ABQ3XQE2_9ACTN|nr:ATP-binding protein [Actinoplanes couchii]MDR6323736.1 anti-sigma regulatory factor (Ser/Thr protein kinase) [Actinoplanes couchii]GID60630.1 histidine kinase [Actinoplanes couchii]
MTSPPTPVPYPEAIEIRRWTLDDVGGLRHLRAGLRAAVAGTSLDTEDGLDRLTVVGTELATNALRHGSPPTVIRLLREPGLLILDVADHDLTGEPHFDLTRPVGLGGLGLRLVKTFATNFGWHRTTNTKHIWATFDLVRG